VKQNRRLAMARIVGEQTKLIVEVIVDYNSDIPLDYRRRSFIEGELQHFADENLQQRMKVLRFPGEQENDEETIPDQDHPF
jgi:hypothetical protein